MFRESFQSVVAEATPESDFAITPERQVELANTLNELQNTPEFQEAAYTEQLALLAECAANQFGSTLSSEAHPELVAPSEFKLDKPWGGYVTLHHHNYGATKLLFVRPVPTEIPTEWNWNGEYAVTIRQLVGRVGVALSFQRHTDDRTEIWRSISGEGHYLLSDVADEHSQLPEITARPILGDGVISHPGTHWHSAVNVSTSNFLVIHEVITIPEDSSKIFDETNIERAHDLFSRAGTNENR